MAALTQAAPLYRRPAEEPARLEQLQHLDPAEVREPADLGDALLRLLESPNLCSREWVYRQYDQLVGGNTVVRPGGAISVRFVELDRDLVGVPGPDAHGASSLGIGNPAVVIRHGILDNATTDAR